MGGGTEFALACTFRVVTDNPKTSMGLPETSLGIIPGWGGSQRLPRLVGLTEGVTMIASGRPVKAPKAYKLKLADAIISQEFRKEKTEEFIQTLLKPEERKKILQARNNGGLQSLLLEKNPLGRKFLFHKARKDILSKTKGHYPAPILAVNLIENSCTLPLKQGLNMEIQTLTRDAAGGFDISNNLINLFFTSEALKKDKGVKEDVTPLTIKSGAVIGAGTMGSGIAWLFSNNKLPVRFKDINWEAVGKGYSVVWDIYSKQIRDKRIKRDEAALKFDIVGGSLDYTGFQHADLIIEAAVENLELKNKIFKELEEVIKPTAIVASNTSSLSITEMAKAFKNPERFVGMHFFNPPNKMPLVEVIAGEKTSPQTIATAVDICKKFGKTPLVVKDCAGFLVNRLFVPGANEVMWMLQEGVEESRLEKELLDFGMPMSPFVLSDEVGNDVSFKVSKVLEAAYGSRMKAPDLVQALYDKKLFGKKTGAGFYIWKGKERSPNPEIKKILAGYPKKFVGLPDQDIQDRFTLIMINEAARCLEEKVVENPAYLDMALIMGIGFPPFRGGLLRHADKLGIDYVVNRLKSFQETFGDRFTPAPLLLEMQKSKKTFYPN
jgi:3-hydroxyacyl-CoA dehydrogenase/enoyl-CoA hydratase/3-hydroxybutyryl-CoA epimerase